VLVLKNVSASLEQLQQRLGYTFRDPELLLCAVTHPSYLQDHPRVTENNQRLEFLGDAVLQLVLTEKLFQLYPNEREGDLSRRRSALAKGAFLAQLGRDLGLDRCLRLGISEVSTGGQNRASNLEDACEAIFGAIYLDSDWLTARRVMLAIFGDLNTRLEAVGDLHNPKGRLQELVQPNYGNGAVRYEVIRTEGGDHERRYFVEVYFLDKPLGQGSGSSKKLAEEAAARAALETLKSKPLA
jgi:ribonuclease-3